MKKIIIIATLLIVSLASHAQSWLNVGNTLQRQSNGTYSNYRFNMGSPGFSYFYSKPQVDSVIAHGATYTAGYGLGLTAFQFRLDSTIAVNKNYFNTVIGTATLNRLGNGYVPYTGAVTDLDLLSTGRQIFAAGGEFGNVSGGFPGFYTINIYNESATGKGAYIAAGGATGIALGISPYNFGSETAKIFGDGHAIFNSSLTSSAFIKTGGTSSQFLKADGSVDGTSYAPSGGGALTYTHIMGYGFLGGNFNNTANITSTLDTSIVVTKTFANRYPLKSTTIAGFDLRNNITLASLTPNYGLVGSAYNASFAQGWRVDTTSLQTINNLFPKADTRYYTKAQSNSLFAPLGSGVTSITGTPNQVIASASTGAVTLSLPQSIATTSTLQFGKLGIGTSATRFLDVLGTTEQLRLAYDATHYVSNTVDASGNYTIAPSGGATNITGSLTTGNHTINNTGSGVAGFTFNNSGNSGATLGYNYSGSVERLQYNTPSGIIPVVTIGSSSTTAAGAFFEFFGMGSPQVTNSEALRFILNNAYTSSGTQDAVIDTKGNGTGTSRNIQINPGGHAGLAITTTGKVGSISAVATPTFRNVFDDGSGNASFSGTVNISSLAAGTAGTDAILVNHGGVIGSVAANYYLPSANISGTANQIPYFSSSNVLTSNSFAKIAINGSFETVGFGVGTAGINDPVTDNPHSVEINNDNGTQQSLKFTTAGPVGGSYPYQNNVHWNRFDGTFASPTNTKANMFFMSMGFRGYDTSPSQSAAAFQVLTLNDWSTSSHPTRFNFDVTNVGSTTRSSAFQIRENSDLWGAKNLIIGQSDKQAWNTAYTTLTMAGNQGFRSQSGLNNSMWFNNLYYDAVGWKYASNGYGSSLNLDDTGNLIFATAPNSTAGSVATPANKFTVDINGNATLSGSLTTSGTNGGTFGGTLKSSGFENATATFGAGSTTPNGFNYTIQGNAASGAVTVALPAAGTYIGIIYIIKKIDSSANTVSITANGSETIDGVATKTISTQYSGYTIQSTGSSWIIIGSF